MGSAPKARSREEEKERERERASWKTWKRGEGRSFYDDKDEKREKEDYEIIVGFFDSTIVVVGRRRRRGENLEETQNFRRVSFQFSLIKSRVDVFNRTCIKYLY